MWFWETRFRDIQKEDQEKRKPLKTVTALAEIQSQEGLSEESPKIYLRIVYRN